MLNMYQLWLDDLYPRAKFLDALALVEKTGHTKRMQMIRKNMIYDKSEQPDADNDVEMGGEVQQDGGVEGQERQTEGGLDGPEPIPEIQETVEMADNHDPDEDELDALLAESAQAQTKAPTAPKARVETRDDDPFADEMEAMADMDW
jgi:replication fork protection complex subunit Csm3/Swi3